MPPGGNRELPAELRDRCTRAPGSMNRRESASCGVSARLLRRPAELLELRPRNPPDGGSVCSICLELRDAGDRPHDLDPAAVHARVPRDSARRTRRRCSAGPTGFRRPDRTRCRTLFLSPYAKSRWMLAPASPPIAAPAAKNGLSLGVDPSSFSRRITPLRCALSGLGPAELVVGRSGGRRPAAAGSASGRAGRGRPTRRRASRPARRRARRRRGCPRAGCAESFWPGGSGPPSFWNARNIEQVAVEHQPGSRPPEAIDAVCRAAGPGAGRRCPAVRTSRRDHSSTAALPA